jgi:hypothetical protein
MTKPASLVGVAGLGLSFPRMLRDYPEFESLAVPPPGAHAHAQQQQDMLARDP